MLTIPPRLKSANAILALTAALTGAVSFWGAGRYLEARASAVERRLNSQYVTERIAVAAADLPEGTVLGRGDMAARAVPVRFASSDRVSAQRAGALSGRRIAHAVRKGDPLTWSDLEPQEVAVLSTRLESGQRAVTFPVDEVNSFSGLLTPGDLIDLLYSTRDDGRSRQVIPLLQAARVLATGRMLKRARLKDAGYRDHDVESEFVTVTLHVAPNDAARIVLAQQTGDLTAVLRNASDLDPARFVHLDANSLLRPAGEDARGVARRGVTADYVDLIIGGAGGAVARARRVMVLSASSTSSAPQKELLQ
ncbi:MAG: Flp pilus assembly protein CpaB [Steroidobacteraceae bacterium]